MALSLSRYLSLMSEIPMVELKSGIQLMKSRIDGHYAVGSISSVIRVTSAIERSALVALAQGRDPYRGAPAEVCGEIAALLHRLSDKGILTTHTTFRESRNLSVAELAQGERRAPEIAELQWRDRDSRKLDERRAVVIELSGRSRTLTILHSILAASGVSDIRFYDRSTASAIRASDIGVEGITTQELGLNFYQRSDMTRSGISLNPSASGSSRENEPVTLTIHDGPVDIDQLLQWLNSRRTHFVIHPSIGGESALGPLVIPGKSPCLRCLELYELDRFGHTQMARIPLTERVELSVARAHYIAALVAEQILNFIDGAGECGEVTYLSATDMREPQVVAISRHPLCGCSNF